MVGIENAALSVATMNSNTCGRAGRQGELSMLHDYGLITAKYAHASLYLI